MMRRAPQRGMTLLELMVALVIMALSVTLIYRAVGGSARGIRSLERQQGAAQLADSLLDAFSVVDPGGIEAEGKDGDYHWQVTSTPFDTPGLPENAVALHTLHIVIGRGGQRWQFDTLRPQRPLQPGEREP